MFSAQEMLSKQCQAKSETDTNYVKDDNSHMEKKSQI
jgi:hypothetical protein